MVLDESTCFLDPADMELVSSQWENSPAHPKYPGLIWVGLKFSRIMGVIPESRLLLFMRTAERRFEVEELARAESVGEFPAGDPMEGFPEPGPAGGNTPVVMEAEAAASVTGTSGAAAPVEVKRQPPPWQTELSSWGPMSCTKSATWTPSPTPRWGTFILS
jgi:hypothetical protein